MSVLLSDVLDIPLAAGDEDYVLRLTDGIDKTRIAATIDEYVVTPALVQAFDSALGLVAESMTTGVSRGAFLSGSFGSGKSHFMAVLYALLRHDSTARAKEDLQSVIGKHDSVLRDKNVLPLAFHLLAAKSMEEALFSGYVRQIRTLHPDAPLPALYNADKLFADADQLRSTARDEWFFAGLNGDPDGPGGRAIQADPWSKLLGDDVTWTAQTYADAKAAAPGAELRQRLVTALTRKYFTSYTSQAEFVDIDTGLAVIAEHAKSLGHDAVVLFLDELVLWLAFGVQDREFFRVESQKLTKLVESGTGPRAVPLISFVARQMDLRRWFADSGASGAEQEALDRAFRHQEGRFGTITLGDDNLPYVAHRRLLRRRPDNPQADLTLQDAFARISRTPAIWDVLLDGVNTDDRHRGADEEAFRLTYPFSPALVSTLRDLASVMQRERTALKVMQQMLVDRRDALTVDDVIPVGDSFDYIVSGSQPLDAQAAALFKSASVIYREKLRPLILADNNLTEADPAKLTPAFRAHDRLAKTLLLAAVAPRVPALKELTASRLASLNHGSIRSPLPGSEAGIVLTKVKQWSQRVPEIHVGADPKNPVIRVELSDVDYESVVENAKGEDNDGRRRELIRDLVREALGVAELNPDAFGAYYHPVTWRGSRRTVDLVFGNVRDTGWLTDDHFRSRAGTWRFVIDFPFDDPGFSSAQDLERLEKIMERGPRERVIAWLPRFLSPERMADVSRLVILDWLLSGTGDRWRNNADHLSEVDRAQARAILETQQRALREGLRRAIQEAYGAARETPGTLAEDTSQDKILHSLDFGFTPANPVGADLGAAFGNLVDQAFSSTYPAHPHFEPADTEITVRDLQAVYAHVERAVADPEGRVRLEGDIAAVRRVANVLGVGHAAETHFLFGDDRFAPWAAEFERAAARDGVDPGETVTVGRVRKWIEDMRPPVGLRDGVMDLVVLAWAALRTRAWYERGGPVPTPKPGSARPDMELRPEPMPSRAEWQKGASRAEALFGLHVNPYLTASGVAELAADIQQRTGALADDAGAVVPQIEQAYRRLGIDDADGSRLVTAKAGRDLLEGLRKAGGDRVRLIKVLAEAELPGTETAVSNSLTRAREVAAALKAFRWDRLTPLRDAEARGDDRGRSAASALDALRAAVRADEFASRISLALSAAEEALFEWLAAGGGPDPDPVPVPPPGPGPGLVRPVPPAPVPPVGSPDGSAARAAGSDDSSVLTPLTEFLRAHPDQAVVVQWRVAE